MLAVVLFAALRRSAECGYWMLAATAVGAGMAALSRGRGPAPLGQSVALLAVATAAGGSLFPEQRQLAAVAVVAVVVAIAALRPDLGPALRTAMVLGVVAVALFVVVCVAVAPPPQPQSTPGNPLVGLLVAAAVAYLVCGLDGVVPGAVGFAAVATAALYQLGAARLGISRDPLRDALAAADAAGLGAPLSFALVLAALPPAVRWARDQLDRAPVLLAVVCVAGLALGLLVEPVVLAVVAAVVAAVERLTLRRVPGTTPAR